VLQPNDEHPQHAELAVAPTARAGGVYVLAEGRRHRRIHTEVRTQVATIPGVELVMWLAGPNGWPVDRAALHEARPGEVEAVVERDGRQLRFQPGAHARDRRGNGWALDGHREVLGLPRTGAVASSERYPDPLARVWSALTAPHAGDLLVSLEPGYETTDWGGMSHTGGGSHGALEAGDSLVPLLTVGLDPRGRAEREQWRIGDVYELVLAHFGVAGEPATAPDAAPAQTVAR
jgi:hypothetical protein